MIYDYIIIGAGISGLYTAYKILKQNKNAKIIILEKNSIGGRMNIYNFCGTNVNIGAGIGRKNKDYLLINLLSELNVGSTAVKFNVNYSSNISKIDFKKVYSDLKKNYNKETHKNLTFKKYGKLILGNEVYTKFVRFMGYSDYENEDAYETIFHYGFEDNISGSEILYIKWNELLDALCKQISYDKIKLGFTAINIESNDDDKYIVETNKNKEFIGKKIIIATTINTVKQLLPKYSIFNNIKGQTFLRTYGKFDEKSTKIINDLINGYTIVNSPLKKIIPINKEKGIYMIAYTDNKDAIHFSEKLNNKNFFCRELEKTLNLKYKSLKLEAIKSFYWEIGTHYYKPLPEKYKSRKEFIKLCQNPKKNIFVVGELLSTNQGWTQGALESVENIINLVYTNLEI